MEKENNLIHFIITGGTIDSYYNGTKDTVEPMENSCIPDFIKSLKLHEKTIFSQICMKDSRALTKKDMKDIVKCAEKSPSKKIIISHGTYSMPDTAKYLKNNLKRKDQVIIFTGSMIPLLGFSPSDAPFNLGYAISEVQRLQIGIFVAMNGKTFSPEEVVKLLYQGRFISVFNK